MQKLIVIILFIITFSISALANLPIKTRCPQTDPSTWTNCYGKKTNDNSGVYEGEFLNGKYHGKGSFIFGDWKYIGDFKNGLREGKGILYYPNGSTYEGAFQNNVKSGFGILKAKDNSLNISGQFKEDKLNGKGTEIKSDGHKYFGTFKDNLYEGSGKQIYPNGDEIEGTFKAGILIPNAVTYYIKSGDKSGDKFIGDFNKEGKHFKKGTYFHMNGDKFIGEFDEKSQKLNGVHYFANNTSAKVTNGKSEWLNPPVVSSKKNSPVFAVESIKPRKDGFFSTIIGVLSFFIIPILMYKPVAHLLSRTKNEALKWGIILLSLIIFYVVLISIHEFIGFNIAGRCFPQLHRFSDC